MPRAKKVENDTPPTPPPSSSDGFWQNRVMLTAIGAVTLLAVLLIAFIVLNLNQAPKPEETAVGRPVPVSTTPSAESSPAAEPVASQPPKSELDISLENVDKSLSKLDADLDSADQSLNDTPVDLTTE